MSYIDTYFTTLSAYAENLLEYVFIDFQTFLYVTLTFILIKNDSFHSILVLFESAVKNIKCTTCKILAHPNVPHSLCPAFLKHILPPSEFYGTLHILYSDGE